jgi:uncharacterized protein (TIGR03435 family)
MLASSVGRVFAQTAAVASVPAVFEVSTIKLSHAASSGSRSSYKDGRFSASNITLKNIIQYSAYEVPELRILDGPKWLGSERFDIEAKADSSLSARLETLGRDQRRAELHAMVQQLLADRFKLKVHWETRELPVYDLVVGRKGSLLQETKAAGQNIHASTGEFTAKGLTLAQFAQALAQELSRELGRVVVDKTGIMGRYDATLTWTPEEGETPISRGTDGGAAADAGPTIFTAIQEQLGLKLESAKGPVQVLVIDQVEMPTEN